MPWLMVVFLAVFAWLPETSVTVSAFRGNHNEREYTSTRHIPQWKQQACDRSQKTREKSHYVCDERGDVKCLSGWQGDLCQVPMCRRGCDPMNGFCQRPGECRCRIGFTGELCDKCIRLPGCAHGTCSKPFECTCQPGWDGLFCTEPTCRPGCHQTRGYCESPGECRCRLGWAGRNCADCAVLPGCAHGTCNKPLECLCLPGYTGLLCQTPLCAADCHKQRGYCRKPGECRCKVGWAGATCEKCFPYPGCVHGRCEKPWECNCESGWAGMLCDERLSYCDDNRDACQNDGRCIPLTKDEGSYRCQCRPGYYGNNCEQVDEFVRTSTAAPRITPPPQPLAAWNAIDLEATAQEAGMVNMLTATSTIAATQLMATSPITPIIAAGKEQNITSEVAKAPLPVLNKTAPTHAVLPAAAIMTMNLGPATAHLSADNVNNAAGLEGPGHVAGILPDQVHNDKEIESSENSKDDNDNDDDDDDDDDDFEEDDDHNDGNGLLKNHNHDVSIPPIPDLGMREETPAIKPIQNVPPKDVNEVDTVNHTKQQAARPAPGQLQIAGFGISGKPPSITVVRRGQGTPATTTPNGKSKITKLVAVAVLNATDATTSKPTSSPPPTRPTPTYELGNDAILNLKVEHFSHRFPNDVLRDDGSGTADNMANDRNQSEDNDEDDYDGDGDDEAEEDYETTGDVVAEAVNQLIPSILR